MLKGGVKGESLPSRKVRQQIVTPESPSTCIYISVYRKLHTHTLTHAITQVGRQAGMHTLALFSELYITSLVSALFIEFYIISLSSAS